MRSTVDESAGALAFMVHSNGLYPAVQSDPTTRAPAPHLMIAGQYCLVTP